MQPHAEIVWEKVPVFPDASWGWVGEIKAFSIRRNGFQRTLSARLPSRKGMIVGPQSLRTERLAKIAASLILDEFLRHLFTTRQEKAESDKP